MRISDWISDVCSSDLLFIARQQILLAAGRARIDIIRSPQEGRVRHARIGGDVDLVDVWQIRIAERGDIDGIARSALASLIVRSDDVDAVVTRAVGERWGKDAHKSGGYDPAKPRARGITR